MNIEQIIQEYDLTPKQSDTYRILLDCWEQRYNPTYRELMQRLGLQSLSPVQERIKRLQKKGLVQRSRSTRSIQIVIFPAVEAT